MVQLRADPNAVISAAGGQALIDEISEEKRKEFWGEGIYLRDMLRNQMPLVWGATHNYIYNLPANSWEFIFPKPESEILINVNISHSDKNPTSGLYSGK